MRRDNRVADRLLLVVVERPWLLVEVERWLLQQGPPTLLLTGAPGSGKTTFTFTRRLVQLSTAETRRRRSDVGFREKKCAPLGESALIQHMQQLLGLLDAEAADPDLGSLRIELLRQMAALES